MLATLKKKDQCHLKVSLTGFCMYFLRTSTKRTLGEETFQREIMAGLVNASLNENLLWNIERTVSNVFIPLLNTNCMGDKGSNQLLIKVIFILVDNQSFPFMTIKTLFT